MESAHETIERSGEQIADTDANQRARFELGMR
jgi:hypothetical protein